MIPTVDVHAISLADQPERRRHLERELLQLNYLRLHLHVVNGNLQDRKRGCVLSHMSMYEYARDNNLNWILVVEDNIRATESAKNVETFQEFFRDIDIIGKRCGIVYLSGTFFPHYGDPSPTSWSYLLDVTSKVVGASAYVIFRPAYERMLAWKDVPGEHRAIDEIMRDTEIAYLHNPLMFHRAHSVLSTVNPHQDGVRRFWFSDEWYDWCERNFTRRRFSPMLCLVFVLISGFVYVAFVGLIRSCMC